MYWTIFFCGVLGSIVSIFFGYGNFSEIMDSWSSAVFPMTPWSWISLPVILTLSTMALPFVFRTINWKTSSESEMTQVLIIPPIFTLCAFLVAYPGSDSFLVSEPSSFVTATICCSVVQICVSFFTDFEVSEIWNKKIFQADQKSLKWGNEIGGVLIRHLDRYFREGLAVKPDMGEVELEVSPECHYDSWRNLEIGGEILGGGGSNLTTRHSLLAMDHVYIKGDLTVKHVLFLKKGASISGDLKARKVISFGDLSVRGDITVEESIICEGFIRCDGKVSTGGVVEAFQEPGGPLISKINDVESFARVHEKIKQRRSVSISKPRG